MNLYAFHGRGELSIFGNLEQMPLADLLPLLAAKDGVLEIFGLKNQGQATLVLSAGMLRCLFLKGVEVDPVRARVVMAALLKSRRGAFEFSPGLADKRCGKPLDWSVTHLLLSTVTLQDELQNEAGGLPHPDTRFVATTGHPDLAEDAALADFFYDARGYLDRGASASELARAMQLPLNYIRWNLAKLRRLGAVHVAARTAGKGRVNSGVARTLLARLRQRFFGGKGDRSR